MREDGTRRGARRAVSESPAYAAAEALGTGDIDPQLPRGSPGRSGVLREVGAERAELEDDRRSRGRGPGGWIFASEVEIAFEPSQIFRPDVSGWRRERLRTLLGEAPVTVRPDWVCEILSSSNPRNHLIKKMRVYQRCQVQHYWILDPEAETLSVHRWTVEGYLTVQTAEGDERLRAEPFTEVELSVRGLVEGDESA